MPLLLVEFEIAVTTTQPDDLAHIAVRSAKGRLVVATILVVRVAVHLVEDGNEAVCGVEGGMRGLFDLRPHIEPGSATPSGLEGVNGARAQPRARTQRLITASFAPSSFRRRVTSALEAGQASAGSAGRWNITCRETGVPLDEPAGSLPLLH